jgi:hypothetical protein
MVSRSQTSQNQKNSRKSAARAGEADPIAEGKKMTEDVFDYLTDYARENPGTAALWCLGVGFVLGWKIKPW